MAASIGFAFRVLIRARVLRRCWAIARMGAGVVCPEGEITATRRRYRGDTLILETEIETASGAVRLIDFMPPRGENPDIVRIVEGLRGSVRMKMELIIRFDYGHVVPWVRKRDGGSGSDRRARCPDLAHAGRNAGRRSDHGRGFHGRGRRARAVCADLVSVARKTAARDPSGTRAATRRNAYWTEWAKQLSRAG